MAQITANDIHDLFKDLKSRKWCEVKDIPFENGIYIMYDKEEFFKDECRIVRIGTHGLNKNNDGLKSRLKKHYNSNHRKNSPGGNESSSIFRKKIGKAFLKNDPNLQTEWTNETITDKKKKKEIEGKISDYINEHIIFKTVEINTPDQRKWFEAALLSTLNQDDEFKHSISPNWLGHNTEEQTIKDSGLWITKELDRQPLSNDKKWKELKGFVKESIRKEKTKQKPQNKKQNKLNLNQ